MANGKLRKSKTAKTPAPMVIETGSGNVFADLDLPDPEGLLAKAELVQKIGHLLKKQKLTEAKAAAFLGVPRPELAGLLRGELDLYPTEQLFRFLNALGQ